MLNIVVGVSLFTLPIMGYAWVAKKMDGEK
jgi:hypothetical protein